MMQNPMTAEVKDFIFQSIDSVELLEILLLLFTHSERSWTSTEISDHLRSSKNSVEKRLQSLVTQKLITNAPDKDSFQIVLGNEKLNALFLDLNEAYRVHKYKVLEMIFSPMKKSRDFADAFKLSSSKDDKGDRNG